MKADELTVAFSEDGKEKVRELGKVVLAESPSWVTIAFLFEEPGGPKKVALRRYKKRGGRFVVDKHFVLNTDRQAHELAKAIAVWFPDAPSTTSTDDDA